MLRRRPVRSSLVRALLAVALVTGVSALLNPQAASAHGDEAALSVVTTAARPDGTVDYRIRAVYNNDGDPIPGLAISATAVGPDGSITAPVTLDATDVVGEYQGTLTFPGPGDWTVRFEVADPAGELELAQQIAPVPTTVTEAPTTAATPTTTTAPSPATTSGSAEPLPASASDDSISTLAIVGIVAALLIVAAAAVVVLRRRGAQV